MDYQAQQAAYEEKQRIRKTAAQILQAKYPKLVPAGNNSLVAAAKNIRTELKIAFPDVAFSVKSSRFSGGDSIDVRWTDGPTTKQVDAIIGKYSAGSFDGMTDSYDYSHSAWTDAFGDAKYVHSSREWSDAAVQQAIDELYSKWANEGDPKPTFQDFNHGKLYQFRLSRHDVPMDRLLTELLSNRGAS